VVQTIITDQKGDIDQADDAGRTALMWASSRGHYSVVELLLAKGANVNAQDGYYGTALQAASRNGHKEIVQILLKNGADVNALGGIYETARQAASENGHEKIVQILLERGAVDIPESVRCKVTKEEKMHEGIANSIVASSQSEEVNSRT
jgi:ankyrin repeat protein